MCVVYLFGNLRVLVGGGGEEGQINLPSLFSSGESVEPSHRDGDRQLSVTSTRASEPSLLGSGWSWQTPNNAKEGLDHLLHSGFINDTAENRGLLRGLSKQASIQRSENE